VAVRPSVARAVLGLAAACGIAAGCSREGDWRQYREVTAAAGRAEAPAAQQASAPSGDLTWTAPTGWKEERGSGMRLASFAVGSGASTGLCTIIRLGGTAGGLEANVRRWIGQIGLPDPGEQDLADFLGRQQKLSLDGGWEGRIVDLTQMGDPGAEAGSMLACSLSGAGSTVFVKLTGPVSLLRQESANFSSLCRSLRGED
jgi:hypothetical protein